MCSSAKRRTRKLSIRNQPPQRKSTCTLAAHQAWRALAVLTETSTSPGTPQDSSACPDEDAQPAGDSGRGADACSLGLGLREGSRKPGAAGQCCPPAGVRCCPPAAGAALELGAPPADDARAWGAPGSLQGTSSATGKGRNVREICLSDTGRRGG